MPCGPFDAALFGVAEVSDRGEHGLCDAMGSTLWLNRGRTTVSDVALSDLRLTLAPL